MAAFHPAGEGASLRDHDENVAVEVVIPQTVPNILNDVPEQVRSTVPSFKSSKVIKRSSFQTIMPFRSYPDETTEDVLDRARDCLSWPGRRT